MAGGFRNAEVDHLGDRLVVVEGDQHVRRFDVAVNDAFLMGVLHGQADRHEEFQSFARCEFPIVAELCDRYALHEFHDEEGKAAGGGAGVEHFGDVRVIHHGERLPLGFEPREHGLRIHSSLDELHGHGSLHRLGLLGHPHGAHATLTDLLD